MGAVPLLSDWEAAPPHQTSSLQRGAMPLHQTGAPALPPHPALPCSSCLLPPPPVSYAPSGHLATVLSLPRGPLLGLLSSR